MKPNKTMKYHFKFYLWENGKKSTDYTEYAVTPFFYEDNLDETLDSGQITLDRMPIATRAAFPPKTKFRVERYDNVELTGEPKKWDMLVEHDDVEEYPGCPTICCHRIHCQEASIVAQGMHVDNIDLTYELNDVTLNYKTTTSNTDRVAFNTSAGDGGYNDGATRQTDNINDATTNEMSFYFRNSYRYEWQNTSSVRNLYLELNGAEQQNINFTIPTLMCRGCHTQGTWADLFEVNTITRVYRTTLLNEVPQSSTKTLILTKNSGATSFTAISDDVQERTTTTASLRAINDYEGTTQTTVYLRQFNSLYTTHSVLSTANSGYTKDCSFTTTILSEDEIATGKSYLYSIEIVANPTNQEGMIQYYEKRSLNQIKWTEGLPSSRYISQVITTTQSLTYPSANIFVNSPQGTVFNVKDMSKEAGDFPFLMKGVKYSCFDLLRVALLTIDTQIINNDLIGLDPIYETDPTTGAIVDKGIQYPIIIDPLWDSRLKTAKMQETIFEVKNLWEVLIQIGYYLHAIPYLEFAEGDDRFVLKFRQLGDTKTKADTSTKITIFNSKNLSEYFTSYDSYVTNLFSPQNLVDEWVNIKTSDSTYLISNNTSEIQTKYPISEIVEFDISINNGTPQSALQYIFEESVYSVLTPIYTIIPSKGYALTYKLGDNKITGLTYTPPAVSGENPMALKNIVRRIFGTETANLRFSTLKFHIKYRTQDNLRLTQFRPDLQNFVKNSKYEKYPHHEQFYGQQDKIVDSERFSANLWGKLIRVANNIYQRQEQVTQGNEKESGDLVMINDEAYYVMSTENECYPDAIFQKVTYSKNFNQISNIVTIPSEPRFYEVSERSKIRREVRIMEFLNLSTTQNATATSPQYLNNSSWQTFIKNIIFKDSEPTLPNFAYTRFKADKKRIHTGAFGQVVQPNQLFPSSEVEKLSDNTTQPKTSSDHADCIVPLLHFPMHDAIVFEWDMDDNFKAGDFIDTSVSGAGNTNDDAYYSMQPLRYCDIMGRADLFTFKLFNKTNWTISQSRGLPRVDGNTVKIPTDNESQIYLPEPYSIGLDKGNRSEISFNYQINLLHRASEGDKEDFLTYPNLFGDKYGRLKMCLSNKSQSLFDENVELSGALILADNIAYQLLDTQNAIEVRITPPTGIDLSQVQSIVLYDQELDDGGVPLGNKSSVVIKNVGHLADNKKLQSWWIYPVYND